MQEVWRSQCICEHSGLKYSSRSAEGVYVSIAEKSKSKEFWRECGMSMAS
jgi:hypothetical protein